jgi:hypothetical protein
MWFIGLCKQPQLTSRYCGFQFLCTNVRFSNTLCFYYKIVVTSALIDTYISFCSRVTRLFCQTLPRCYPLRLDLLNLFSAVFWCVLFNIVYMLLTLLRPLRYYTLCRRLDNETKKQTTRKKYFYNT